MSFFSASEKEALLNLLDTDLKRGVFCLTTKCDNKFVDSSEINKRDVDIDCNDVDDKSNDDFLT